MRGTEKVTIAFDCILTEYRHIHFLKDLCILSDISGITKHERHFIELAMIITFMVATVGARFRVHTDIDRSSHAFSARNVNNKYIFTVNHLRLNHIMGNDVCAYLLTIVDHVPEIFLQLLNIDIFRHKLSVLFLPYAEQNDTDRYWQRPNRSPKMILGNRLFASLASS